MRRGDPPFTIAPFLLLGIAALAFMIAAKAGQPMIDHIEPFLTNQVLIHFDTEANRSYELQYTAAASNSDQSGIVVWSNLYVAPNLPFPNHYVIVDTRTAKQRFYRLRVTP